VHQLEIKVVNIDARCDHEDYIRHLGRYLDKVKYKLFVNIKEV